MRDAWATGLNAFHVGLLDYWAGKKSKLHCVVTVLLRAFFKRSLVSVPSSLFLHHFITSHSLLVSTLSGYTSDELKAASVRSTSRRRKK